MRVLVTGITGLLGKYLVNGSPSISEIHGLSRGAWAPSIDAVCTMHQDGLKSFTAISQIIDELRPEVIVHTAAEGSVDAVEGRLEENRWLNVGLPLALSALCAAEGITFVHISSNAVFGGSETPYSDFSPFSPVNDYGRLKVEAEDAVMAANPRALVIRPILMYGWPYPKGRGNPAVNWLHDLRARRPIKVVDDVTTEPLAAWDCAEAVWRGIQFRMSGPVNISGGASMSLYDFAVVLCETFGLDEALVQPIASSSLVGLAPRPRNTMFDLVRLRTEIGIEPTPPSHGLATLRDSEG
jgi:dTDP-4-dehydrorhamnose reductase